MEVSTIKPNKLNPIITILLTFCISMVMFQCSTAVNAETAKPTRVINVVYDDSGSMIDNDTGYHDGWCQAKYALEVFSAMLEKNDTMNVYAMSDFSYYGIDYYAVPPHITLMGQNEASDNVSQVHSMLTDASATPFETVMTAYTDLSEITADEKWLVVLTDGSFAKFENETQVSVSKNEIDAYFAAKDSDVSIMYLAIGSGASTITEDESNDIYLESAVSNMDILTKITEISNRIFDRNRLQVDAANRSFSFDIPMNELIVFAQGKNVKINGIQSQTGTEFTSDGQPVEVKYSEVAATDYSNDSNVIVNKNLEGKIAYFTGDFDAGDYMVDVSGADTIEIYYRPNVDIAIHLVNSEGTRLSTSDPIPQGTYTLEYVFVKAGTDDMLPQSELLGTIDFSASVSFNGTLDGKQYGNGDSITVQEGSMDIEATAKYLDYNTVSTSLHYDIFQDKPLKFSIDDDNEYVINTAGFENPISPMLLTVSLEDRQLTAEEWQALDIPEIELISKEKLGELRIKKTEQIGVYKIYPSVYNDSPRENALGNFAFYISLNQKIGMNVWSGQTDGVLHISDGMSPFQRYPWLIPFLISIAALILLLIWWMTRKVLPKHIRIRRDSTEFIVAPSRKAQEGVKARCVYTRKSGKLVIHSPKCERTPEAQCSVTLRVKPVDRRYVKSAKRQICIVGIASGSACSLTINGVMYAQNAQGQWVEEAYLETEEHRPIEQIVKDPDIRMETGTAKRMISSCECQLVHK